MTTLCKSLSRFAAVLIAAGALRASEIQVPWSTFTGGGGIAQHGAVALGGAIGPIAPALSPASGGDYTLAGGFWPALSGQPQPVAPVLKIQLLGSNKVRLSWPVTLSGFVLEYTTQLGSGIWHVENGAIADTIDEHTVTVPNSGLIQAYRLRSL